MAISVNRIYPSQWINAEDITKPVTVYIVRVTIENVRNRDGSRADRICLAFRGAQKRLLLNKTQASTLASAYGDDAEKWAGLQVMLAPGRAPNGKATIVVTAPATPAHAEPTDDPAPDDDDPTETEGSRTAWDALQTARQEREK